MTKFVSVTFAIFILSCIIFIACTYYKDQKINEWYDTAIYSDSDLDYSIGIGKDSLCLLSVCMCIIIKSEPLHLGFQESASSTI